MDAIANVLVGIGLFLYGLRLITVSMRKAAGRKLRLFFKKWTSSKITGLLFGFISGAITQSTSSASLIIISFVNGKLIPVANAIPVVAAANIGTVMIVFLVSINIKLGLLYILGITAILYSMNKNIREQPATGIVLGICLLLYGFQLLKSGTQPLVHLEGLNAVLHTFHNHWGFFILFYLTGFLLRLVTQSTSSVTVLVITLVTSGLVGLEQAMFMVLGSPLGSALTVYVATRKNRGPARQIFLFQAAFDMVGSLLMALLLTVDLTTGFPLLRKPIVLLTSDLAGQISLILLFMRVIPFIISFVFAGKIAGILSALSRPSHESKLSDTKFIYDEALEEPEAAIDLIEKEQTRLIERFPLYLENVREEPETEEFIKPQVLHAAALSVGNEITEFTRELFNKNLSPKTSARLLNVQNRQDLVMMIDNSICSFVEEIATGKDLQHTCRLYGMIVESLHAVLNYGLDVIQSGDPEEIAQLLVITKDKGSVMEKIRKPFYEESREMSYEGRNSVMYVTDLYQRIIWLVHNWSNLTLVELKRSSTDRIVINP